MASHVWHVRRRESKCRGEEDRWQRTRGRSSGERSTAEREQVVVDGGQMCDGRGAEMRSSMGGDDGGSGTGWPVVRECDRGIGEKGERRRWPGKVDLVEVWSVLSACGGDVVDDGFAREDESIVVARDAADGSIA
jgi:hypothetical protein